METDARFVGCRGMGTFNKNRVDMVTVGLYFTLAHPPWCRPDALS